MDPEKYQELILQILFPSSPDVCHPRLGTVLIRGLPGSGKSRAETSAPQECPKCGTPLVRTVFDPCASSETVAGVSCLNCEHYQACLSGCRYYICPNCDYTCGGLFET